MSESEKRLIGMDQKKYLEQTSKLINLMLQYDDYKSAFFILIKMLENSNIDYYREFSKKW
tara:strand:- start:936 stop:1115 length:180 start_codon:yes stop_codon:yes gene_type:complete